MNSTVHTTLPDDVAAPILISYFRHYMGGGNLLHIACIGKTIINGTIPLKLQTID